MNTQKLRILMALAVALLMAAAALALLEALAKAQSAPEAHASRDWTVCTSGPPDCQFTDIQEAVDAASDGDVIKIAAGTYDSVHGRPVPPGYPYPQDSGTITQVVYLSKSVTLRGGYTTTFSDPPDPDANPVTLDAQRGGRVLCITGNISPTVAGLRLTRGSAYGLGGHGAIDWTDCGGGVYVMTAAVTFNQNYVSDNWANDGGGLFLYGSDATLSQNRVISNGANWGGGMYLLSDTVRLIGNEVSSNNAYGGGGIYLAFSDATFISNTIVTNTAEAPPKGAGRGGGLWLRDSDATLIENTIIYNAAANFCGGLELSSSRATLSGNIVSFNYATLWGDGLCLNGSDATLLNNVIANNYGDGVDIEACSPRLIHTTIARNRSAGVHIGYDTSAALTNTILVSNAVGVYGQSGTIRLEATLWGDDAWANGTDWLGAATIITGTVNLWGAPDFEEPDAGDYHIGPDSIALDSGLDAHVWSDIDREPRPHRAPDLGADEYWPPGVLKYAFLPLVLDNY